MEYKRYEQESYMIHTLKIDKFKNCVLDIAFRNELVKEKITARNLVGDILVRSSLNYPKNKDIVIKAETLYNTGITMSSSYLGKMAINSAGINFLNPKYCDPGTVEQIFEFVFELLLKPNIKQGQFPDRDFIFIKSRLEAEIKSIKAKAASYAVRRSLILMDEESPSSYNASGYLEDLSQITPKSLVKTYQEVIASNKCDITIIGDLDMDYMVELVKKNFIRPKVIACEPKLFITNKPRAKAQIIKEVDNYKQARLVMIYNILEPTKRERDLIYSIYNIILGSGSLETKLARHLREEKSLCYSVSSFFRKREDLLIISTGIDKKNYEEAVAIIKKTMQEMIEDISDQEFINSKTKVLSHIKMAQDSQVDIASNYLFNYLDQVPLYEDEIIALEKITKNEVQDLAKKMKINTIYLLSDGEK